MGLSSEDVSKRIQVYGKNRMDQGKTPSFASLFFAQFKDFLILVLLAAAVISGIAGEISDAMLIIVIVIMNALIGTVQEKKAQTSMAALKRLTIPEAKVLRNGKRVIVKSDDLVPGDIVYLDAGDFVPADGRLIEEASLKITEASLTGESVPVDKDTTAITDPLTALGDRSNSVYMTSLVNYGRGQFIVTATGMNSEIGKIAGMIQGTHSIQTPLQKRLDELGRILASGAIFACVAVFAIGLIRGGDPLLLFLTAVSLAVAAIPEGLPAIVTVVLAIGVQKLVSKNALIRKLPAVETLGCASVICCDKTGTLTQNRMTIEKIIANDQIQNASDLKAKIMNGPEKMIVEIGMLCNDASIITSKDGVQQIGDPTEVAMIDLAESLDYNQSAVAMKLPRVGELPFDSQRKMMTTIHRVGDTWYSFTKGAPDIMLERVRYYFRDNQIIPMNDELARGLTDKINILSDQAYRVIAYAYRQYDTMPEVSAENLEHDLIFCGMTGMIDPPREEVKEAIKICKRAGIKTVMITGDHKNTAVAIAKQLDLFEKDSLAYTGTELSEMNDKELHDRIKNIAVFARVAPEHKVRIVNAWQRKGHVVAMTGDGVNDAPALKKADIGCAMGITGTDVSKEAAEMILTDDNFATIVAAVREGRGIYANIKKAVHFLLSCNIAEILILFMATIIGWVQPLLPIHILWINLITDSLPALALGVEKNSAEIMNEKPRSPKESIFAHGMGGRIVFQGMVLAAITLMVYQTGFANYNVEVARTMCFAVLGFSQITHALNVRSQKNSIFSSRLFTNPYLWGALGISCVLQLAVLLVPAFQSVFNVVAMNTAQWFVVFIGSVCPILVVELTKLIGHVMRKYFIQTKK
ncbi:HAD-IC family P-type ATPase [Acetobacterium fimetarium]|uniref:HAD-IC family P-type ATPase n=2 Tax=Acetobacterium fimetarium TaxID=52691 RepID=A0ABR6WRP6_9FIRM|nr:HAD-IC family P-type ATPase [Acetobacterium fimetarium]